MGIRSLSTASISTGTKRSKIWDQSAVVITNSFESIATTTVGAGGTSTITFSSIPSTFKHLQIRALTRSTAAANSDNINLAFNGSSTNYYAYHQFYGTGGTVYANASNASNYIQAGYFPASNQTASIFGATIIDILDYTNTNKNKVTRALTGYDWGGDGIPLVRSGLWANTSAVTSISMTAAGNFAQYSSFALYGIRG